MYILIGSALLLLIVFAVVSIVWLYNVGPKTAQTYAQLSLPQFVCTADVPWASPDSDFVTRWNRNNFLDARGKGPFDPERVGKPLNIYDLDGWLLFRDFAVRLSNGRELRARTAASSILGAPLFSIGVDDQPRDIPTLIEKAKEVATTQKLIPVKGDRALVCYAYPALGLLCRDAKGKLWTIDLADHARSEVASAKQRTAGPSGHGGHVPWSVYKDNQPGSRVQGQLEGFMRYWSASSQLRKSNANPSKPSALPGRILDVNLKPQLTAHTCAVAAAQMVLGKIMGPQAPTRHAIETEMHPDALGVPPEAQRDGYERLTHGHGNFTITLDDRPTFADVQREIEAGRPFASGLRNHARVTVGWTETGPGESERFIYVLDPEPEDKGSRYFEAWRAVRTFTHIYVVRKPSP